MNINFVQKPSLSIENPNAKTFASEANETVLPSKLGRRKTLNQAG